jgi:hypothetical protein
VRIIIFFRIIRGPLDGSGCRQEPSLPPGLSRDGEGILLANGFIKLFRKINNGLFLHKYIDYEKYK